MTISAKLNQIALSKGNLKLGGAMGVFFGLKFGFGLALIGISSALLSVGGFVTFSQLFLFFALLSTVAAAGVQNGLVRQIAAADGDIEAEQLAASSAFRIWIAVSVILVLLAAIFRTPLSHLLVGDESLASAIPLATAAGSTGGFGVLGCAILSGRQRAASSLSLQSAGLIVGGTLCIIWLSAGDPVGAVFGYAFGPIVTSLLAAIAVHRGGIRFLPSQHNQASEIRLLLGFSLAFLGIAVIMPATLFGLRLAYREAFGTEQLAYWLAANRVSDVTSQILGLYMTQIFLPQITRETEPRQIRRLLTVTFVVGTTVMMSGWAVFSLAAPFFVTTFFSKLYLPAIPFISGYLLGDGLRVTASLAMQYMLARRFLHSAVGIELSTACLLVVYTLTLVGLGYVQAPYWAYPAAYATMAMILILILLRKQRSLRKILKWIEIWK